MRSQDGARNPLSAPTTELWAPTVSAPFGSCQLERPQQLVKRSLRSAQE